jgi:anhydro-N-acetylmuramic acid kinase
MSAAADPILRLVELRARPLRRVIGLLSGTSADGTDAALCEIEGAGPDTRVRLVAFESVPYDAALRARLHDARRASAEKLCELNVLMGENFARAALAVAAKAGLAAADIDLIGSHGQTVSHLPRSAFPVGSTLQIGEAAVIAELTGAPVVCDFRVRDVAAGGEGAPLVPLADYYLFRTDGRVRALQNIGGIANVTVVSAALADLLAFDTGPGNMPLDAIARAASHGRDSYDLGGARAARGSVDAVLCAELHRLPFFDRPPPRSTGREEFGDAWLVPLLARFVGRLDDLAATVNRFVAESIHRAYVRWVFPRLAVDEVLISGGGVHNLTLMGHLAELFAPVPVRSTAEVGMDPDAKEAVAFAILANETLFGLPGNLPVATGARGPRVLGKIVPA